MAHIGLGSPAFAADARRAVQRRRRRLARSARAGRRAATPVGRPRASAMRDSTGRETAAGC